MKKMAHQDFMELTYGLAMFSTLLSAKRRESRRRRLYRFVRKAVGLPLQPQKLAVVELLEGVSEGAGRALAFAIGDPSTTSDGAQAVAPEVGSHEA